MNVLNHFKVRIILSGEDNESKIRCLNPDNKYAFKRNGIDSFVMSVNK